MQKLVHLKPDNPNLGVIQGKLLKKSLQDNPKKSMVEWAGMKIVGELTSIEELMDDPGTTEN